MMDKEPTKTEAVTQPKSMIIKYQIMSIEKIDAPAGMPGDNWHHYVVGQGTSKIEGAKAGTLKEVTEYVETFTEDLNGRAKIGSTAYAARKKKKTLPPTPPK